MQDLHERLQQLGLSHGFHANRSLRVDTLSGPKVIKRIYPANLGDQAFIVTGEIPGLRIHNSAQVFSLGDKLYQLADADPELEPVKDPMQCLDIVNLYVHSCNIKMLTPTLRIDELVRSHHTNRDVAKGDGHPRAKEVSLESLIDLFYSSTKNLYPEDESRFRTGLFHEDLQTGNILSGQGSLHIIDLDPIWHTYSVMNLAHFFVDEVVGKQRVDCFDTIRNHFLSVLEEESERDFDFFVLLSMYRSLIRRAFHKNIFADSLETDFVWYFREFAFNFYLRRVPSGE